MSKFQDPAGDIVELSSFAQDIDVVADYGKAARAVEVVAAGSGTLAVVTIGSNGATRTLTVANGWFRPIQVRTIKAATNVATLQLYF